MIKECRTAFSLLLLAPLGAGRVGHGLLLDAALVRAALDAEVAVLAPEPCRIMSAGTGFSARNSIVLPSHHSH